MRSGWEADAAYMEWAKLGSAAPFNLATSGVGSLPLEALGVTPGDLELTGSSPYGYEPLREAVALHAGARPENVVLAAGASMANHLALAGLLEPGDEVLTEEPSYPLLPAVVRYLGAAVVTFPRRAEDAFRVRPEEIARRLTPRTRLIVVTNLHNPSSVLTEVPVLRALGELAREARCRVLVDEVYLEALFEARPPSAFHLGREFVVTSSLTKAYGLSGLRCGWILAEEALAQALWRLNDLFAATAPHAVERLAVAAFRRLASLEGRARRLLDANRLLLERLLEGEPSLDAVTTPFGTTSFPRLRAGRVDDFCDLLRRSFDTSVVPGRFFGAEGHFRIGIGGPTAEVAEGLARLGRALEGWR